MSLDQPGETLRTTPAEGAWQERRGALRAEIDRADAAILAALGERFAIVREMGVLKREAGLAPRRPRREAEILAAWLDRGERLGLDSSFLRRLHELVLGEARRIQREPAE